MHILIIPFARYAIPFARYATKENPLEGIFEYHQAHALQRAGLQVGVVAPTPRSLRLLKRGITGWAAGIEFEDDQGIPTYRYQAWDWATGRIPYLTTWFRLEIGKSIFKRYVAAQGMPDVIHAHNAIYAGAIAALLKREYHIPYVMTEHSTAYARGKIRQWQIPIVRNALSNADVRIVVSANLGKLLEAQFGEVVRPWKWIPNILGKTFEKAVLPDEREAHTGEALRFLNVANLVETKNHAGLLKAFAYKFKGKSDVQLRIGGDGPLRGELEALAEDLGIASQVVFLGLLGREQVRSEMQACDVCVLSSDHETFGVVLIEALACGKPVVATASGGPECIVHPGNGVLVPPRDVTALGNAMAEVLQGIDSYDSTFIRQDCIARFGENAVVEELRNAYVRVLT
jgi:glycosyltransferase involved in cell wall biosynthesis